MLRTLLSGLPVIQVAVVVHDLEACAARQRANLGNGAWRVYDLGPHVIDRYLLRGEPATGHTLVALNDKHPQTEILQPLGGTSLHQEWLDERGEGLHHVGVWGATRSSGRSVLSTARVRRRRQRQVRVPRHPRRWA